MRKTVGVLLTLLSAAVLSIGAPAAAGTTGGGFFLDCFYSHAAPDDPIVFPGVPGASHLHEFFGNRSVNATSTYESLGTSTTCRLLPDASGYWNPASYLNGVRTATAKIRIYYQNTGSGTLETIPAGLQMVAGDSHATSAAANPHVSWACGGSSSFRSHPYNCAGYGTQEVVGRVDFATCWDGTGLARTDVAYPSSGACPSGFQHAIPLVSYRVHFGIVDPCAGATPCAIDDAPDRNIKLTLSSGPYYTLHADFWNAWDAATLNSLVQNCMNAHVACGEQSSSPTLPGAPFLSATPAPGGVALSWTPPADKGGSPITGYAVYRSTSQGNEIPFGATPLATVGGVTSYQDSSASPGTVYFYRVAPANGVGLGAPSNEASGTAQPPVLPGAPTLAATAGSSVVHLSWTAPSNGGSAITSYNVYRGPASGAETLLTTVGAVTSFDDSTVANGMTSFYQVAAVNTVGEGPTSNEVSSTPQTATVPGAPTLAATGGNGVVQLSWTVPADGGSPITGYGLYRGTASGAETLLTTVGAGASFDDTTVTNGTTYFYEVTALNAVGEGSRSNEASSTPQTAPTTPGSPKLSGSPGNAVVHLTWTVPGDGGSPITGYTVYRGTASGGETMLTTLAAVTSFDDTTVTNGTTYFYQVTALNAAGEGSRSNEISKVPKAPVLPGAPTLSAQPRFGGGITLTWAAPPNGGCALTGYRIYRSTSSGAETFDVAVGKVTSYADKGTTTGTVYYYRISAVNCVGEGPLSNEASAQAA